MEFLVLHPLEKLPNYAGGCSTRHGEVDPEDFVFVEHVKLPPGWKADLTDNEVKIFDTDQNFVMMYPVPRAEDALGNYEDGAYTLEQTDGGFVLQMTMDMKWLKDDFRSYPIVIDPSFELMN